jgi:hypothetical protein
MSVNDDRGAGLQGSPASEAEPDGAPTAEEMSLLLGCLDDLEGSALQLALDGDATAGLDVLRRCSQGLYRGNLSDALRIYLADRLSEIVGGVPPARALGIEVIRDNRGRPKSPFPDWEYPLAAFGALLAHRNYIPARIAEAMDDLRLSRMR